MLNSVLGSIYTAQDGVIFNRYYFNERGIKMDEKQVKEQLAGIDDLLAKAVIVQPVLNRIDHINLTKAVKNIADALAEGFAAIKELSDLKADK